MKILEQVSEKAEQYCARYMAGLIHNYGTKALIRSLFIVLQEN